MKKILLSALCIMLLGSSVTINVNAETTNLTNSSESMTTNVFVSSEKNSTFTVGLPVTAELGPTTGTGYYQINVRGDIDSGHKLVVSPVDKYTQADGDTTDDCNFLLSNQANSNLKKEDVIVTVTSDKTEFLHNEFTTSNAAVANVTLQASALNAGTWKGVIEYNISLEAIQ